MKRWLLLVALLALALAAPLPQVYDRLETTLARARLDNPTGALAALDQAQGLLRQKAEGLPPVLRDAAISNLQEARQAVLRKSPVDLEARLLLVRHLLGKALYDGFFTAQGEEKALYLSRLVRATGLGQDAVREVAGLPPEEARKRLEGRYLALMAQDLAQALAATSRPQAYLALARAYARYLVIQDSQRSTLKAQDFIQALAKVSGGEAFRPEVQELQKKVAAWRQALLSQAPLPSPGSTASTPPYPTPPLSPTAPSTPTPSPKTSPAAPPPSKPALPENLLEEISFLPFSPEVSLQVGEALHRLAYPSLLDWLALLDEVRGSLARAQLYTASGQHALARDHLVYAHSRFRLAIYPVVGAYAPDLAQRTDNFFLKMQNAAGLRTVDFALLLGEIQEIEERLFGSTLGPWHALQVQLGLLLLGIPRAVFFLLAAALAFFPLYLIRLTFGGRNIYWNLLGLAFLFLLLPILAEGLSYFGSVMAEYGGLPWLAALANLSIGQGLFPYLAWGLTVFLVVALAGAGLRGIAAQFGLLKERGAEVTASGIESKPATTLTSETIVEWDEEF